PGPAGHRPGHPPAPARALLRRTGRRHLRRPHRGPGAGDRTVADRDLPAECRAAAAEQPPTPSGMAPGSVSPAAGQPADGSDGAAVLARAFRAEPALSKLQLLIPRKLDGLLQGDYLGLLPGPGTEPGESREYRPGDDVRRMDWPVTARTTVPHVRQ